LHRPPGFGPLAFIELAIAIAIKLFQNLPLHLFPIGTLPPALLGLGSIAACLGLGLSSALTTLQMVGTAIAWASLGARLLGAFLTSIGRTILTAIALGTPPLLQVLAALTWPLCPITLRSATLGPLRLITLWPATVGMLGLITLRLAAVRMLRPIARLVTTARSLRLIALRSAPAWTLCLIALRTTPVGPLGAVAAAMVHEGFQPAKLATVEHAVAIGIKTLHELVGTRLLSVLLRRGAGQQSGAG
jgi:hypothetical protein